MYTGWESKQEEMSEKEKDELDNYFQKKYFQNKDYFKLKHDETNPWNLTRKLYNQTEDKKDKAQEDYVEFHPYTADSYYVHKDELKYYAKYPLYYHVLYDYRYVIVIGLFSAFVYGISDLYFKEDNKEKTPERKLLSQAK